MTVGDILQAVRKSLALVIVIVLACVTAAIAAFYLTTPKYSSTAQVFVSTQGQSSTSELLQGSSFAQARVKSYAVLVPSPIVLQPVIDELGLNVTPEELKESVSAASPLNTVLINITTTSTNPGMAQKISDEAARQFVDVVADLEKSGTSNTSPVRVTITQPAQLPEKPDSPKLLINLAAGLLLGAITAIGVALARAMLDTVVRRTEDAKQITDSPIIGEVRADDTFTTGKPPVHEDPTSVISEEFRQIRTNMMFVASASETSVQMFTSAIQGEGKTTIVCNLALAYAQNGQRVCIVDADLRRPNVANYLGLEGSVGLTTALIGEASLRDMVQRWGTTNVWVLPSGQVPPNPSELLGSAAFEETIAILGEKFDVVIIDAPPLVPVADASILASIVKDVVLVAGCTKVHKHQLHQAIDKLKSVDNKPQGIIINRAPRKHRSRYGKYGYYEEYKQETPTPPVKKKVPTG